MPKPVKFSNLLLLSQFLLDLLKRNLTSQNFIGKTTEIPINNPTEKKGILMLKHYLKYQRNPKNQRQLS